MAKRAADIVQVKVRMRADTHAALHREAEKRGQTLNAEILRRLEQSFELDEIKETTAAALLRLENNAEDLKREAEELRRLGEELRAEAKSTGGLRL